MRRVECERVYRHPTERADAHILLLRRRPKCQPTLRHPKVLNISNEATAGLLSYVCTCVQLLALYSEKGSADGSDEWDDSVRDKRMAGILEELRLLIINLHS